MTQHDHKHEHHGHDHHGHGHSSRKKRGLHKDWRTWVVVVLVLAAMLMYVVSDDESIQPSGKTAPPVPAAP